MNRGSPLATAGDIHFDGARAPALLGRRRLLAAAAATGGGVAVAGCATNPATGRRSYTGNVSLEDDVKIGRQEHPRLVAQFGGEYQDKRLQGYVERTGLALARHTEYQQFPYQVTLLDSPIVNAFALPGGYVYVTRGLLALASNEAEMAGVIAHEMGHVNARHTAERISSSQLAQVGLVGLGILGAVLGAPSEVMQAGMQAGQQIAALSIQSHSRKQEFEADMLGVRYMSRAGYEPDAMVSFLSTLREQSILEAEALGLPAGKVDEYNHMSTHPRTVDRVREAQEAAETARPAAPRLGRKDYLAAIDGMLFGDDPAEGLITGRTFTHRDLRFEFEAPQDMRLHNGKERVIAQGRDGAVLIFDLAPMRSRSVADYVAREWTEGGHVQGLQRLESRGGEAATALAQATIGKQRRKVRLAAIRNDQQSVWRFTFILPPQGARQRDAQFIRTAEGFRRLGEKEASRIKPLRVDVRQAGGSGVSRLSRDLPYGEQNDAWFRMINDLPSGAEPGRRDTVKVIRA